MKLYYELNRAEKARFKDLEIAKLQYLLCGRCGEQNTALSFAISIVTRDECVFLFRKLVCIRS